MISILQRFKKVVLSLLVITLSMVFTATLYAQEKERIVVLTDIENEPDDAMSLVRYLTYSNQWDTEGIIATTSIHQQNEIATWRILEILDAYEKVQPNLLKHEKDYPTAKYLRSVVKEGRKDYGMNAVGEGMDSEGSDHIIEVVDKEDSHPVWVLVWGGPNCLAQALWKVKNTRSPEEVAKFVSKIRVYTISDQDDSGPWLRKTFPKLFYIASPGFHGYGGYHMATWTGISGDKFHGRFAGGNFEIVDNPWLDEHIRSKGPLGAEYPHMDYLMEGDSPSFMHLIDVGLGNPEKPDWGGWGGRYEHYRPRTEKWFIEPETRPLWTNARDEVFGEDGSWHTSNYATIFRWREAYQNDFVARMDWTIKPYEETNHPPVPELAHSNQVTAELGGRVELSAEGSTDPDGDQLSYEWFHYDEPGTFTISNGRTGNPLKIDDSDQVKASFTIPENAGRAGTLHIVLAVTDNGVPALTRYKRVVINVEPKK
ncbi:nucleoside hydrolase-like domain-containing protein [Pseudozobellia sp. WGM2]|uniref:nucleoside hydrolase-like domain-containing protein n=1 Tax=Pseudozobellia sp. WGM2 TaxID=2787625 RepID=UPI001AE06D8E|nr:nucleoside hydrolase-like domain-containing protein [Pseudozobellia sp. WGM2]